MISTSAKPASVRSYIGHSLGCKSRRFRPSFLHAADRSLTLPDRSRAELFSRGRSSPAIPPSLLAREIGCRLPPSPPTTALRPSKFVASGITSPGSGRRGNRWRLLSSRYFGENAFQVVIRDGFDQMMIKSGLGRQGLFSLLAPARLCDD